MTYIRLSIAKPRKGQEARLEELMRRLSDLSLQHAGCKESYVLRPHDDSGELARIAVYEDEHAADRTANDATIMAIRSEMHLASEAGHSERGFFSI